MNCQNLNVPHLLSISIILFIFHRSLPSYVLFDEWTWKQNVLPKMSEEEEEKEDEERRRASTTEPLSSLHLILTVFYYAENTNNNNQAKTDNKNWIANCCLFVTVSFFCKQKKKAILLLFIERYSGKHIKSSIAIEILPSNNLFTLSIACRLCVREEDEEEKNWMILKSENIQYCSPFCLT